jgi:hypothetical protein
MGHPGLCGWVGGEADSFATLRNDKQKLWDDKQSSEIKQKLSDDKQSSEIKQKLRDDKQGCLAGEGIAASCSGIAASCCGDCYSCRGGCSFVIS